MKRNEPHWKREAARKHCKARKQQMWDKLSGRYDWDEYNWEARRWVRAAEINRIKHLSTTVEFL